MQEPFDFFLSYSRKDVHLVRRLYRRLSQEGFSIWLDVDRMLPGQDWGLEIENAIKQAKGVIICLSSQWLDQEGFVHAELRQALERMKRLPEGKVFLVPVRLDECKLPAAISKLHAVDLDAPGGYNDLQRTLKALLPASKNDSVADERVGWNVVADLICEGKVRFHSVDAWGTALTQEGLQFKQLLRGRLEESVELDRHHEYSEIVQLWTPLFGLPHFQTGHEEWKDAPYFRCQIHAAHCQLFTAYVLLGRDDLDAKRKYYPPGVDELEIVVTEHPYSMDGSADDRLPRDAAQAQNENYLSTLRFAKEFLEAWGGGGMKIFGVSEARALAVESEVDARVAELEYVLRVGTAQ